jgi:uncharacterized protein
MAQKRNDIESTEMSPDLQRKLSELKRILADMPGVVIAFSGGVDSTLLLRVAVDTLGDRALAIIARSPSLPARELEDARGMVEQIGARLEIIETDELDNAAYQANAPDRCFHCKKTLFARLTELAESRDLGTVIEGSNLSDLADYRPGSRAVLEYGVRSPLREAGLTKDEIRVISRHLKLPTWDKPAAPCLSSRIPYGMPVTIEKLGRIERAEDYLRSLGLRELRVRDHGEVARIEVPREAFDLLLEDSRRTEITEKLREFGYRYVALDLLGFRSGSLNEGIKKGMDE